MSAESPTRWTILIEGSEELPQPYIPLFFCSAFDSELHFGILLPGDSQNLRWWYYFSEKKRYGLYWVRQWYCPEAPSMAEHMAWLEAKEAGRQKMLDEFIAQRPGYGTNAFSEGSV